MEFSRQEYWSGEDPLLQGIFLIQGSKPGLLHCTQILYCLSHLPFFKSSLFNLLQYYFCFTFWIFGCKACGILAPWQGIEPTSLALDVKVFFFFFLSMNKSILFSFLFNFIIVIIIFYFTILCWFFHTSTCIRHGYTRVPHPEPPYHPSGSSQCTSPKLQVLTATGPPGKSREDCLQS